MIDTIKSNRAVGIALALILIAYTIVFAPFFITREYTPVHDFNAAFVPGHIVTNYLYNGHLPLWSPEQNSGSPLWPDVETFPAYDPISMAVNLIYASKGISTVFAHAVTMFIWHAIFALGGALFFRALGLSRGGAIFGFAVLLFSSLTALNFRQPDDYVTVYKYIPLLMYAALMFVRKPSLISGGALGVLAGLNITGYQTTNVILVMFFALTAAFPFKGHLNRGMFRMLIPGAVITLLMSMPLVIAGVFWVTNVATARLMFPWGYRGALTDITGPLGGHIPNETMIYIGWVAILLAMVRIIKTVREHAIGEQKGYGADEFMFVFGMLLWIMNIGIFEHITGVDKPFLMMRSFNNMIPYIIFVLAYFAAKEIDSLIGNTTEGKRSILNPVLILLIAAIAVTVFSELIRPRIVSLAFNRYTENPKPSGIALVAPQNAFNAFHYLTSGAAAALVIGLFISLTRGAKKTALVCLILLTMLDLGVDNKRILTLGNATWRVGAPIGEFPYNGEMPVANARFAKQPPMNRAYELNILKNTYWYKQGNETFHIYSATSELAYTWFRTKEFHEFESKVTDREKFKALTGVTTPIIGFATSVIVADDSGLLDAVKRIPISELHRVIVVGSKDMPEGLQTELQPLASANLDVDEYGPNNIKISYEIATPAYLRYLDSYAPGWHAYLDDKEVPIIRANYLFKSVYAPEGRHTVEFRYRPIWYLIALTARLVGYALSLGLLVLALTNKGKYLDRIFLKKEQA